MLTFKLLGLTILGGVVVGGVIWAEGKFWEWTRGHREIRDGDGMLSLSMLGLMVWLWWKCCRTRKCTASTHKKQGPKHLAYWKELDVEY